MDGKKLNKITCSYVVYVLLFVIGLQLIWSTLCSYHMLSYVTNLIYSIYHYKISPTMLPMHLQLHATNCHLQLTLIDFITILYP
jgi:hypothetical protein